MKIFILLILAGFAALASHRPAAGQASLLFESPFMRSAQDEAAAVDHAKESSRQAALFVERMRLDGRRSLHPTIVILPTVSAAVLNTPSPLDACSAGAPWARSPEITVVGRTEQHYIGIARLIVGRGDCPIRVNATLEFQLSNPPEGSRVRRVFFVVSYVTHKQPVE
jgi:hypothetical protein